MSAWVTFARKPTKCARCEKMMEAGTPLVVSSIPKGKYGMARRWKTQVRRHVKCWLRHELAYLRDNPYVPIRSPGRPKIDLSPEDKLQRNRVLRRRASINWRQKRAALAVDVTRVLQLEVQKQELIDQISRYGEVPKGWIINEE